MWTVLCTLLHLCVCALLCGADSDVQLRDGMAPFLVKFHSVNFRNVLHWRQHPKPPKDLRYFVQYKVYGDTQWNVCKSCQAIHQLQCDLSQETADPRQWYYARIQARSSSGVSPWVISSRFYPQWDTTFSPPKLRLNVTDQGIVVWIKPPRTPAHGQGNSRVSVTKLLKLTFRIYLTQDGVEQVHETTGCPRKMLIEHLSPKTMYCIQAETVMPLSVLKSSRSPKSCISTL
ncbi:Interleukin-22 receptor subunit alpha-2 [Bagarius yarrelli]|uniref:Interleukin-22 receptor subunit alpha-2 n=1 Tax=Bagarius yarrelli TaxID=175774 RepID=A0A556TMJ2_BAGYA|nr:Interleukin-22 receptor subunit alpha-2 [Bagarius yarrelli]